VGPTVHCIWLSLGNEVLYIRLDKTGLLNHHLLVSKARTRNLGNLTSLWNKTMLELKDSQTFYDANDIPKWLNQLHLLDDYRNFSWEDFVRDVWSGSGVTPEWKRVDNKGGGTTLASARALCLDRLSRVWLRISGGLNCCQESRRGVI